MAAVVVFALTLLFAFLGSPFKDYGKQWLKKTVDDYPHPKTAAGLAALKEEVLKDAKTAHDFDAVFTRAAMASIGVLLIVQEHTDGAARTIGVGLAVASLLFVPSLLGRLTPDKRWELPGLGKQPIARVLITAVAAVGLVGSLLVSVASQTDSTPSPTTDTSTTTSSPGP